MRLALVGATGLVGSRMLKVLEERGLPVTELYPAASERSAGKKVLFKGKEFTVMTIPEAVKLKPDAALFSAGAAVSLEWAPEFAKKGTFVIDNSSAWRMESHIKLVVPEVNAHVLEPEDKIIANPNCSTIQLVVALNPLHKKFVIKRIIVSTYQSVSGTGMRAVAQMENERKGIKGPMIYPCPIDKNCFPHGGYFTDSGYTSEEVKLVNETRKIMDAPEIAICATVARVPVFAGHSESVNIEFRNPYDLEEIRHILKSSPGIIVMDDPKNNIYPTPLIAEGKDEVFVGRIRRDTGIENGLDLWVVSDNLRKGAATNAVQILEYLLDKYMIRHD